MTLSTEPSQTAETQLLTAVLGAKGFYDGILLSDDELQQLRGMVKQQWMACIVSRFPKLQRQLESTSVSHYHQLLAKNPEVDHKSLWPKKNRIFTPETVQCIRQMPFMKELERQCGEFAIANEEYIYQEEIYWRLARPSDGNDVGPMHADKWFWDLGHGNMPKGYNRVKIWIPLYCEKGLNGLRYVSGSHLKPWPFEGVERDGFVKPQITLTEEQLNTEPFYTEPGQAIVFNDELLHGGLVGGVQSRVSVEFTILVPEQHYQAAKRLVS